MLWSLFPRAAIGHIHATSPATEEYNCIAWAIDTDRYFIWPDEDGFLPWPPTLPRTPDLATFTAFFNLAHFRDSPPPENDFAAFEYVAIYGQNGLVEHAARLLPAGLWTSKLGDKADISHRMAADIVNDEYGQILKFMRRPRRIGGYPLPELKPDPPVLFTADGRAIHFPPRD